MKNTKYYVFRQARYGGPHACHYWTGEMTAAGNPAKTGMTLDAKAFDTAREAYNEAGKHKKLNWWKVGEREPEALH